MNCLWGITAGGALAVALASCGGSTSTKTGDSPGDGGPAAPVSGDSGAPGNPGPTPGDGGGPTPVDATAPAPALDAGPMTGCGADSPAPATLAGTWDVQGSRASERPGTATIRIDDSHFTYSAGSGGDSLTFSATGSTLSLVWQEPSRAPVNIATMHTASTLAQGILPLPLGGFWSFAGSEPGSPTHCQAQIGAPTITAGCVGTSQFPRPLPSSLDGSLTATRTQTLPSLFGDLGGAWHLVGNGGGTCDATFHGNTLSVLCTSAESFTGQATLTFCDGVASGSTSGGLEISALRQ